MGQTWVWVVSKPIPGFFSPWAIPPSSLKDNKITGLNTGRTFIIARSKPFPGIADTLQVLVLAGHPVEKVVIADKSLGPIYVGGSIVRFSASVLPGDAPQQIQWKIPNGSIATVDDSGRVTGRTPGAAVVYAVSLADSSKKDSAVIQVKRDMPQLNPGRDTVVSLGTTVAFARRRKSKRIDRPVQMGSGRGFNLGRFRHGRQDGLAQV